LKQQQQQQGIDGFEQMMLHIPLPDAKPHFRFFTVVFFNGLY
jgi:hypothetical protein